MTTRPRSKASEKIPYGGYCLYCYAPMERARVASAHCPVCDKQVLRVDRERRWTLEPVFLRIELVSTLAIWIACLLVLVQAALADLGFKLGYVVALPVVGGFLHVTVSKLTRRLAGVRFDILWGIAAPGFAFCLFAIVFFVIANSNLDLEPPRSWRPFLGPLSLVGLACCSLVAVLLARRIERWKARRVRVRMEAHLLSNVGSRLNVPVK